MIPDSNLEEESNAKNRVAGAPNIQGNQPSEKQNQQNQ
jgi:hypothetical protein